MKPVRAIRTIAYRFTTQLGERKRHGKNKEIAPSTFYLTVPINLIRALSLKEGDLISWQMNAYTPVPNSEPEQPNDTDSDNQMLLAK